VRSVLLRLRVGLAIVIGLLISGSLGVPTMLLPGPPAMLAFRSCAASGAGSTVHPTPLAAAHRRRSTGLVTSSASACTATRELCWGLQTNCRFLVDRNTVNRWSSSFEISARFAWT
jgi:hypothetical protein